MTDQTSFITTAIPFVNARPHVGFAYELVLADILARHRRRRGRDVRFITGTDDHSLKNVVAAAREGVSTRELVDRNTAAFRELGPLVDAVPDDFIATSTDPRHRRAVEWLWRTCDARGDLYRKRWHGRYCAGCEAFVEDDVLVCDEHGTEPEPVSEENWFFRLSRNRDAIRDAITTGRVAIVPDGARAETLAFLDGEVRDLSVSRIATRAAGWGLPVPGDPSQVIYVWFDALVNYVTALGLGGDTALLDRYWRNDGDRTHVIGKGITRFHAVYWLAFLISAGLPLPTTIAVHGYLTVDGQKIGKSRGNTIAGVPTFVERCGADALRWYFARRCRTRADSDVSFAAIIDAHDGDLADRLGNLVQRCATLAAGDAIPACTIATDLDERIDRALDAFAFDDAAAAIVETLDVANRSLETTRPWRLAKTDRGAALAALAAPVAIARTAATALLPFVPSTARTILARFAGDRLIVGPPSIPRRRSTTG